MRSLVAVGRSASVSNNSVLWPTLTISAAAALFKVSSIHSARAWDFTSLMVFAACCVISFSFY
jgi:hypothetical protein